jgi:hypothetical protein
MEVGMSKEQWLDEFERLYNAAEERFGKVPNAVYDSLAEKADRAYRDRLGDMADDARRLRKEGKL